MSEKEEPFISKQSLQRSRMDSLALASSTNHSDRQYPTKTSPLQQQTDKLSPLHPPFILQLSSLFLARDEDNLAASQQKTDVSVRTELGGP